MQTHSTAVMQHMTLIRERTLFPMDEKRQTLEDKTATEAYWQNRALKDLALYTLNLPCRVYFQTSARERRNRDTNLRGHAEVKTLNRIYEVQGSNRGQTTCYTDVCFLWVFSVTSGKWRDSTEKYHCTLVPHSFEFNMYKHNLVS